MTHSPNAHSTGLSYEERLLNISPKTPSLPALDHITPPTHQEQIHTLEVAEQGSVRIDLSARSSEQMARGTRLIMRVSSEHYPDTSATLPGLNAIRSTDAPKAMMRGIARNPPLAKSLISCITSPDLGLDEAGALLEQMLGRTVVFGSDKFLANDSPDGITIKFPDENTPDQLLGLIFKPDEHDASQGDVQVTFLDTGDGLAQTVSSEYFLGLLALTADKQVILSGRSTPYPGQQPPHMSFTWLVEGDQPPHQLAEPPPIVSVLRNYLEGSHALPGSSLPNALRP